MLTVKKNGDLQVSSGLAGSLCWAVSFYDAPASVRTETLWNSEWLKSVRESGARGARRAKSNEHIINASATERREAAASTATNP